MSGLANRIFSRGLCECSRLKLFFNKRLAEHRVRQSLRAYYRNGKIPWSVGYFEAKENFIKQQLADERVLTTFARSEELPDGYGIGLDERVVEYPWLFSRLEGKSARMLDAGSVLNHAYLVEHPLLSMRNLSILTLNPEHQAHWQKRVSYLFDDLRKMPFRDEWFDEVVCLSTLEHVGMDNGIYTPDAAYREAQTMDFQLAAKELFRVTKPAGKIWITVPFGKYVNYGWYQQFDLPKLNQLMECFPCGGKKMFFYRYRAEGWQKCGAEDCAELEGVPIFSGRTDLYKNGNNSDLAACSRAIVAMEIIKDS